MIFSFIVNKIGKVEGLRTKYKNSSFTLMKKYYLFLNKGFQHETNSYLPFETDIAGPINFTHGVYGIFISGDAKIGTNCTIYQQVTIGSNMLVDSKGFGSPTIGNNCLIGAGAKIIGNVKIGANCRIGANAVVTKDLPDNSVAIAGKTIIIQKQKLENNNYQKSKNGWGYLNNGRFILETDEAKLKILNKK